MEKKSNIIFPWDAQRKAKSLSNQYAISKDTAFSKDFAI